MLVVASSYILMVMARPTWGAVKHVKRRGIWSSRLVRSAQAPTGSYLATSAPNVARSILIGGPLRDRREEALMAVTEEELEKWLVGHKAETDLKGRPYRCAECLEAWPCPIHRLIEDRREALGLVRDFVRFEGDTRATHVLTGRGRKLLGVPALAPPA